MEILTKEDIDQGKAPQKKLSTSYDVQDKNLELLNYLQYETLHPWISNFINRVYFPSRKFVVMLVVCCISSWLATLKSKLFFHRGHGQYPDTIY